MKRTVSMVVAASGTAIMFAVPALAQAPATAQVWDVRFVVDSTGPFAAGPTATQVGITMFARVGILPNTSATGTANFGVSRVGGAPGVFRWRFHDNVADAATVSQGTIHRGLTMEIDSRQLLDTAGHALAGHFAPFRGSFNPQVAPLYLGANDDPNNGTFFNVPIGQPQVTQLVGARGLNFGSDGSKPVGVATALDGNPANLLGKLTPVYRLYYVPSAASFGVRTISASVSGMSGRYRHHDFFFDPAAAAVPLPDQTFTFMVPAPGAGALMVLAGLTWAWRRRAGARA
ncbi:MAG: hypothetical protein JNK35_00180 [Phycisphaerae bacterium]|nr:hypothetical protein [Phycisphaerae bacterium]